MVALPPLPTSNWCKGLKLWSWYLTPGGSDRTEAVETVTTAPGEEETSAVVEHEAEKPVEEDTGRK